VTDRDRFELKPQLEQREHDLLGIGRGEIVELHAAFLRHSSPIALSHVANFTSCGQFRDSRHRASFRVSEAHFGMATIAKWLVRRSTASTQEGRVATINRPSRAADDFHCTSDLERTVGNRRDR
jgi:hypothetical protein